MESLHEHQLIRSKRRTISLEINEEGRLIVRAPLRASFTLIQDFIAKKRHWIDKNQQRAVQLFQARSQKQFIAGESFLFLGEHYPLEIIPRAPQALEFNGNFQLAAKYAGKAPEVFTKWYKKQARIYISKIVERYALQMQLSYQSIKISSAKKRWGSCNSEGHLSFSWRLIMAPPFAIEYVAVHELAHLKFMNHSKRFWRLVEEYFPNWRQARKWLKEHEHLM